MTTETLLIIVLRLLLPLTILRWPLAGGILAYEAVVGGNYAFVFLLSFR